VKMLWFLGDSVDSRHICSRFRVNSLASFWGIVWTAGLVD